MTAFKQPRYQRPSDKASCAGNCYLLHSRYSFEMWWPSPADRGANVSSLGIQTEAIDIRDQHRGMDKSDATAPSGSSCPRSVSEPRRLATSQHDVHGSRGDP